MAFGHEVIIRWQSFFTYICVGKARLWPVEGCLLPHTLQQTQQRSSAASFKPVVNSFKFHKYYMAFDRQVILRRQTSIITCGGKPPPYPVGLRVNMIYYKVLDQLIGHLETLDIALYGHCVNIYPGSLPRRYSHLRYADHIVKLSNIVKPFCLNAL